MTSVTILCPNGRRQAIKVTPNKTVLQILEEVCEKRGFDPVIHDLKHGRNTLDIGATFRFSGVPNNGKLELVKREAARSLVSEIVIALTLESGERRMKTLSTDRTLADMVRAFQEPGENLLKDDGDKQPVVINMREEVIGVEALEYLTLQSIGLIYGKVALRLVHRFVPEEVLHEISNELQVKKRKLKKTTVESVAIRSEMVRPINQPEKQASLMSNDTSIMSDDTIPVGMDTNLADSGVRPVDGSVSPMDDSRVPMDSGTNLMDGAVNVESAQGQARKETTCQASNEAPLQKTDTKVDNPLEQTTIDTHKVDKASPVQTALPTCDTHTQSPEATTHTDIHECELSDVKCSEYRACDRSPVVFSLKELAEYPSTSTVEDVSDEFFEVTKTDLSNMLRDLREQITKEENAPLLTSSMRQAMLMSSFDKYQYAVIRFHFHDQTVLQAKFRPKETVGSLNEFLQQHLKNKHQQFYLYVTPPKKLLDDPMMSLILAELVPMAIVHVGSHSGTELCLSDEVLALKTSRLEADRLAQLSLPQTANITSDDGRLMADTASRAEMGSARPPKNRTNHHSTAHTSDKIVPKWYRPTGK
ncbi:tether containing UBX domain for GLUT4-like isoform X2 [Watersipora subatra]|uniref:tether containing UBX domain for GLUT4-like isoform X2 n=1 Tax=Watersipora subatra TaxID=2589382 RepID=UPI00355B7067